MSNTNHPMTRARSLSFNPSSRHQLPHPNHRTSSSPTLQHRAQSIESLDLPTSLPLSLLSLRHLLLGHVHQVEERLRSINHHLAHSDSDQSICSSSDETDETEDDAQPSRAHYRTFGTGPNRSTHFVSPSLSPIPSSPLRAFVQQVSVYVDQLKIDLFKTDDSNLDPSSLALPPDSPLSLDHLNASHIQAPLSLPHPSLPELKLKQRFDCMVDSMSIPDAKQLVHTLTLHAEKIQELLSQVSLFAQCPTRFASLSSIPALLPESLSFFRFHEIPLPPSSISSQATMAPQHINPATLRQYFAAESDRLSSLLPAFPTGLSESFAQSSNQLTSALRAYQQEAKIALHDGEIFIREEGEKLKGWVDSETESLRLALQAGASRLLTYHELPHEWKNNRFILNGYRFIPLDRWRELLYSGLQWHNETINIHTHFIGTLSLIYLLCFLWPTTPHTNPESSTLTDRLISFIFVICAIKCLVCSTAWHLFAGCGTLGPFRRLACVDYVGISGLIAASVASAEYYGFYCRPGLAAFYIGFTSGMGLIGMILPFQPFFDRPESKWIRIVFFVSMACSALIPQAHMAYLYGISETVAFYKPGIPSIVSYLSGLFFYASNCPERIRPGWVFDTLFHSHQFWHVAIVVAIWLHWRAIGFFHQNGRTGFSCAADAGRTGATDWMMTMIGSDGRIEL